MINKLFKNKSFLAVTQFITLFAFILIIYGAIGITTQDSDFAKILRNTNLSNLIVWSYWWPLIIVTAIFFGRFWCSICPIEMITSFFGKIGLRKKPSKLLKSGWISTLLYIFILIIGIHTLAIHRIPQYMATYMLILFVVAVITGLIWEKRTFCTYVCPIGHLLGLYSLLSFKKLRVIDKNVCKNCKTKDCISKESHYKFSDRSCTSELYPAKLETNKDCILCGQCFKSCSHDNIAIQKQKIAADLFSNIKLTWAEIAFFIVLSGFVIYEILSEWKVTKGIIMTIPNYINETFNIPSNYTGTIKAIILFILIPATFFFIISLIKKQLSKETLKNGLSQLVLAILPITASMHLVKALLKTTSRIPYWEYVFSDPEGVKTANLIMEKTIILNNDFVELTISPIINILAIALPLIGLIISFYVIKKQEHANKFTKWVSFFTVFLYSAIFIITIISWRFL